MCVYIYIYTPYTLNPKPLYMMPPQRRGGGTPRIAAFLEAAAVRGPLPRDSPRCRFRGSGFRGLGLSGLGVELRFRGLRV